MLQVCGVRYMMLNIVPELQINPEYSIFGLPKGGKLQFYVTYHDTEGSEFSATNNNLKYQLNKIDRVRYHKIPSVFRIIVSKCGQNYAVEF